MILYKYYYNMYGAFLVVLALSYFLIDQAQEVQEVQEAQEKEN